MMPSLTMGNAVQAENIVKYFGDVCALDGVSIQFEKGIVYGLLGPNGAGKTTLIRVLTTLLDPDSGSALVAGVDLIADPVGVRAKVGLAGQFAAVDEHQTGRENVEMVGRLYNLSKSEARSRAAEILERIYLADAADLQVKTYSGGMRRKLDLAASMVGRPEVLFLDEPTTGIDLASRLSLWEMIEEMVDGGTTVLLTTQYLEEADRLADRIGVIDRGKLIAEGTSDELKATLGGDVVEIHVKNDDRALAIECLTRVAKEVPKVEGASLAIPAPDGSNTLTAVVRELDSAAIEPTDIALRKPTLNDVFLALTGHKVEDEGQPSPARSRRGGRE